MLGEPLGRGVGKLSHSSLGILLHSWWFFPLLGFERKMDCDWEMETRMGGAIEAWSGCQVLHHGKLNLCVEIR